MDGDQLRTYLHLVDLPLQLGPSPHPAHLALVHSRHLMRFPYQSRDLHNHLHLAHPSLDLGDLLATLAVRGGHCYQQSELLHGALVSLGYSVARVGSYVLNGKELKDVPRRFHNILVVTLAGELYLVDVGFGPGSPRYPLRFSFLETEEVECCEGERYRLEVTPTFYTLFLRLADTWFPLYAFPRDAATHQPKTVTREETLEMFEELYTSPLTIPIRDIKMCINLQTVDSRLNFLTEGDSHSLKVISKGRRVAEERFGSQEEMLARVRELGVRALGPE